MTMSKYFNRFHGSFTEEIGMSTLKERGLIGSFLPNCIISTQRRKMLRKHSKKYGNILFWNICNRLTRSNTGRSIPTSFGTVI